jgi:DNA-directed RNA polymerase subunit beta'
LQELKDGLFDPTITGGREGTNWSHFRLPEPVPNPLFEEAVKKLTGITQKQYEGYISGQLEYKGKRGGSAIQAMLENIDVGKEMSSVQSKLKTAKGAGRDKLHKKLRILKALDEQGLKPTVYMMESVPVVPPVFRPVTMKEDGSLSNDDLNGLYKDIGSLIESYKEQKRMGIPDSMLGEQRKDIYDGLKAMSGLGGSLTREYRGVIDIISGKTRTRGGGSRGASKGGFFQKNIIKRRQDYTGRSIIIPEPKMGLDELGLPEEIAWEMYKPFIQREMTRSGFNPLDSIQEIKQKSPVARAALERAASDRPVLLKRDPSLHKYNVMAFKPRLVKGKAIEIHPLVTSGYNADFDGDAMSVYLPITEKAVKETGKMFPSNNLFSSTTGAVMYTPGHEALLGMYLLSTPGKRTSKKYKTSQEAKKAAKSGEIKKTDIIRVGGHETTVGRLLIDEVLPEHMRETGKKRVRDMTVYDKGTVKDTLTQIARKYAGSYDKVANTFKDLGNDYSTEVGFSIGLDDFAVINRGERDRLIRNAERKADRIRKDTKLSWQRRHDKIIKTFSDADDKLDRLNDETLKKNPTNIYKMVVSGSRGKPEQLKQIISTPALVKDAKNRTVPFLIDRSYSEGMDVASYWTTLHGARKGTIQKTQGVREPGYLSKLVINSTMGQLVTEDDCGTREGVQMDVDDPDVLDRYLPRGERIGGRRYRRDTLTTPEIVSSARRGNKSTILVRSPLRCKAKDGICKKCMGLNENGRDYDTGTNIGVIAGQSIGEPSTQLSLNVFHTGGLAKGKGAQSFSTFDRMKQLLTMPKEVPDEAPLARKGGRVTKVEKAPQGGDYLYIGNDQHYIPSTQTLAFKRGDTVGRGDALTMDGVVNPKQLLPLKGIEAVQDYLSDQIHGVLKSAAPVRKRNVEVVVKSLTNVTRVDDPGDHPDWAPGDLRPASQVTDWNRKKRGKKSVTHTPVLKGIDVLPKELEEDWIARMNFQDLSRTLAQAAREGWRSNVHGFHPIPALAHATEFGKGKQKLGPEWRGEY